MKNLSSFCNIIWISDIIIVMTIKTGTGCRLKKQNMIGVYCGEKIVREY